MRWYSALGYSVLGVQHVGVQRGGGGLGCLWPHFAGHCVPRAVAGSGGLCPAGFCHSPGQVRVSASVQDELSGLARSPRAPRYAGRGSAAPRGCGDGSARSVQ